MPSHLPPLPPPADPRVGTVISGRYRLDALLGEGGMGRVYAAEHVMMRKRLAVKVLHRELATVPEVVKRFEREAMAAANIEHPNVAAATDFGKIEDGSIFMVMEYVEGSSLRDQIKQGPMSPERALRVARQIASALVSAHDLDIVHRDLKPENVMLITKGKETDFVKVLDFGIAKVPLGSTGASGGGPITKVGMVFGTPEYMAPEQALGQPVDPRADIYALGVILYEMLAGCRPFTSHSQIGILGQQLSTRAPSFAERAPGLSVPPAVEHYVMKLLEREPDERPASARNVVQAIDALRGGEQGRPSMFTQLGGSAPVPPGPTPELSPTVAAESVATETHAASFQAAPAGGVEPALLDAAAAPGGTLLVGSVRSATGVQIPVDTKPAPRQPPAWLPQPLAVGWRALDVWRLGQRAPLDQVPPEGYVAAIGGLAVVGFVVGVSLVIGAARSAPAPDTSTSAVAHRAIPAPEVSTLPLPLPVAAPSADVQEAKKNGLTGLRKLASRFPKDGEVQLALAEAYQANGAHADAMRALAHALEVNGTLAQRPDVATLLWEGVQPEASRELAFRLLEGPMGARGADIAFDLVTSSKIHSSVRDRADKYVSSEQFQKQASPEARVAAKLRAARTCSAVHGTLDDVIEHGDRRSLPFLRRYEYKKGCRIRRRRVDCWPCLRADSKLYDAITATSRRK